MVHGSIDELLSEATEAMVDATLADSFPASDPPSWTLGREKRGTFEPHGELSENNRSSRIQSSAKGDE